MISRFDSLDPDAPIPFALPTPENFPPTAAPAAAQAEQAPHAQPGNPLPPQVPAAGPEAAPAPPPAAPAVAPPSQGHVPARPELFGVVVDLETLGRKPGAVIFEIAAVVVIVDSEGTALLRGNSNSFRARIDAEDAEACGLTCDASTVLWWMKQSHEAREQAWSDELPCEQIGLVDALVKFEQWMRAMREDAGRFGIEFTIWGNSPSFDLSILAAAYDVCGMAAPWEYYEERCFRTLRQLHRDVPLTHRGTKHIGIIDAEAEARCLGDMWEKQMGK